MTAVVGAAQAAAACLAAAGAAQAVLGALCVRRFAAERAAEPAALPPVTVMKPLHGDEPLLEQALATVCAQDYPAFQIVFGVQDPADPARAAAERLRARFPHVDIAVVADPSLHGANRKIGNLMNMMRAAKHDVIVLADSDLHVRPDYLRRIVAALERPGAGLVTTLYGALPAAPSVASALGAGHIAHGFLPGALLGRRLGRQDCLGGTMALRRATLDRIGGLDALADHLADDNVLGQLVRAQGLSVALAPTVPLTTVPETRIADLFRHELRWARTIRALAPLGFALSAVQHPLVWAAAAFALGPSAWTAALFAAVWAVRAAAAAAVDRALAPFFGPLAARAVAKPASLWLLPLRDALSVCVMAASYTGRRVVWRGHALRADDGLPQTAAAPAAGFARAAPYAPDGVLLR